MTDKREGRWLLLMHQIPPKPDYFRVKIWRRLTRLGAVAMKNSVYILPNTEPSYEGFQWVMREVIQGKGDASICEATFIEGMGDQQIEALFNVARNADYKELSDTARKLRKTIPPKIKTSSQKRRDIEAELSRLKKRLSDIVATDFFGASGRESAEGLINEIESRLQSTKPGSATIAGASISPKELEGRQWVTRRGIHVDRIASAWLIRRFIDPDAKLKFVEAKGYHPNPGELRFDMFDAEFTHEGDLCTFEVLILRTHLEEPALKAIAEIIHDIDLRDEKHRREETRGIEALINGICMAHKDDERRLERGSALFDDLYEYFKRKRK